MEAGLLWFCNWSTLGVCAALKLPQIYAQLAARSARGISLPSLLLELAGFLVFLRYQHYYGNPLLTYLEYPILIVQGNLFSSSPAFPPATLPTSQSLFFQTLSSCSSSFISMGT
uniref:Pqlc3 protein n=1 Tax=Rattus norvegicus TaxID=10116 RepID=Q66HG2_RAT|nr:Pqlc3 protein [Rattus norvegicus]